MKETRKNNNARNDEGVTPKTKNKLAGQNVIFGLLLTLVHSFNLKIHC